MTALRHHLRLYWVPEREAPKQRETAVVTESLEDLAAMESEVVANEKLRAELSKLAQTATGAIHDLPQIDGAPQIVERSFASREAGVRYVAWNVYAVSGDSEILLSTKMQNIGGGVMWLEPIRHANTDIAKVVPPQENIDRGYKCDDCRRFNLKMGQDWLNQETHRFDKASSAMWADVLELLEQGLDVEAPRDNRDFGLCLEDSKLVLRDYPGCSQYKPKTTWGRNGESQERTSMGKDPVGSNQPL